jgi:hypothetical protein
VGHRGLSSASAPQSTNNMAGATEMGIETIVVVVVIVLAVLFVLGRVRA